MNGAKLRIALILIGVCATGLQQPAAAWDRQGHAWVGEQAVAGIDAGAKSALDEILGEPAPEAAGHWCNWPDDVRPTAEWAWSEPLHYVNLPRGGQRYDRRRDCPGDACVTEAIKKYASELSDPSLDAERRRQAFGWLCHFVGDIHQPLHVAYADDRGGNEYFFSYRGEETELHEFWDRILLEELFARNEVADYAGYAGRYWAPFMVDHWTDESHQLVDAVAYPPGGEATDGFIGKAGRTMERQLHKAASRLALILNACLGHSGSGYCPTP